MSLGLSVVKNLSQVAPDDRFLILASPGFGYEDAADSTVEVRTVSWPELSSIQRVSLLNRLIPRLCREWRADALFTMGNLPSVRVGIPQLVLFHKSHYVYPDVSNEVLDRRSRLKLTLESVYLRYGIRGKTVAVQTEVIRKRFIETFRVDPRNVVVIPSAGDLSGFGHKEKSEGPHASFIRSFGNKFKMVYLTRYYPHKNLEILLEVAKLAKRESISDIVIFTTIDEQDGVKARQFLRQVQEKSLEDVLVNVGRVPQEDVPNCLATADALLMPTLLESFGLPYLEAMVSGCAILTSDRDFSRNVCQDAALYFDPLDAHDIMRIILYARDNPDIRARVTRIGKRRVRHSWPTWAEVTRSYVSVLHDLASSSSNCNRQL
ncbi:MAG: glycosyltransferase family 4 protein [Trueperella sp.]|nr:glycosyltransferase family 4 protein [Trueperella sp.]